MKRKRVWRYYCEYCKKSGCSAGHMKRHEASCTNNPNRFCGMCHAAGFEQKPMEVLLKALGDGTDLTEIRRITENCPACILAAIRQSRIQYADIDEDGCNSFFVEDFDFRAEKKSFWDSVNQEKYC